MKPLIVLLLTSLIALFCLRLIRGQFDFAGAARIGMSVMLLFTALGHILYTEGMVLMVPNFIPFKQTIVYGTGMLEVMAAIGLLVPRFRIVTAWMLIIFFILVLPANIKASLSHIDYQTATLEGEGTTYLWFRVPLQIFFILWVYGSGVRF